VRRGPRLEKRIRARHPSHRKCVHWADPVLPLDLTGPHRCRGLVQTRSVAEPHSLVRQEKSAGRWNVAGIHLREYLPQVLGSLPFPPGTITAVPIEKTTFEVHSDERYPRLSQRCIYGPAGAICQSAAADPSQGIVAPPGSEQATVSGRRRFRSRRAGISFERPLTTRTFSAYRVCRPHTTDTPLWDNPHCALFTRAARQRDNGPSLR
jgi:hypothetical protein